MDSRKTARSRTGRLSCRSAPTLRPCELEALESRQVLAAPEVTGFVATLSIVAPGEAVTLLGTATDESGIRAMSFFLDRNGNGRFDNGTDQPLGDDFTPDQFGRYSVALTANESWGGTPAFGCNAVDNTGQWAATPSKLGLALAPRWEVTEVVGYQNTTMDWAFQARVVQPSIPGALPTNIVGVTFFQDSNANGRWDGPAVDTDIGFARTFDPYSGAYILPKQIFWWTGTTRIVAVVLDDRVVGNGWGPARSGAVRTNWGWYSFPTASDVVVQTVNSPQVPGAVVTGESFRITANVNGGNYFLRAATFYYDRNSNGLWDKGVDTDLGARFFTGEEYSAPVELTVSRAQLFAAAGFQHIVVAVKNASEYDEWSPSRSQVVRVIDPPRVNSPTTSAPSVVRGQSFFLEFNAPDDFGTRTVSAFLDKNNNGLFDPAIDVVATSAVRILGDTRNGRWRVTVSSLAVTNPGTYTLYMAGVDFEGVWGRRGSTTIQIT